MQTRQNMTGDNDLRASNQARFLRATLWVAGVLLLGVCGLPAQEALRSSLAGEQAAKQRKVSEEAPYNIKMGPLRLRFETSLGLEYVDNINVSDTETLEDFVIRPEFTTDAVWPISAQNSANISLGIGYSKYLTRDENDSLLIRPGSVLSFDFYAGDFKINVHDRFSYYQNPLQQGTVSGTNNLGGTNALAGRYGNGQNTVGISADWDLNKLVLSFGYDHVDSFATSSDFSYTDQSSEYVFLRAAFMLSQGISAGFEATGGLTSYGTAVLNDNRQMSFGPFLNWQLSQYMAANVRGGYVLYEFDSTGIITNTSDTSSVYANVGIEHLVNQYLSHSIGAGYQVSLGVNSDAVKLLFVRHALRWRILRATDINTDFFYESGEEVGSSNPEQFDRFGFTLGLSYQLTRKLGSGLRYSYTVKNSDIAGRDYSQNNVSLTFSYRF